MSDENQNLSPLRVVFYAPGMPFDAVTVREKSLGGSESAAYYLAREVARLGHQVLVFTSQHDAPRSAEGVTYAWVGEASQEHPLGAQFEHYACNTPHDILIAQRLPHVFHRQYAAKVCVWQLHDLALHRTANMILGGTWQMDVVTTVSRWHAEQVKKVWNINPEVLRVVPNGVDPELYAATMKPAISIELSDDEEDWGVHPAPDGYPEVGRELWVPRGKFLLLYQSRPERGFDNALELMAKAKAVGLPVHLLACAYDNPVPQMQGMYDDMYARARALGNVTLLGALSKPELATLQKACDVLLYPTEFEEVSCITAMEAMHARLPLLTSSHAALPETCGTDSGAVLVPMRSDGRADLDKFFSTLTSWFGFHVEKNTEYPEELNALRAKQDEACRTRTWTVAAGQLMKVCREALRKKQRSPAAILRHSIEHSDIAFAAWYLRELDEQALADFDATTDDPNVFKAPKQSEFDAIIETTRAEISRMYTFAHDAKAYKEHYDYHQTKYYDEFEEKVVGENVTGTTRFRGVANLIARHRERTKNRPLRILDYGCAHGHYTIPLARMFPQCEFVGMDISERAVTAARRWASLEGLTNVSFVQGTQAALVVYDGDAEEGVGQFDLVLAGEVLEHVWDYRALLNLFRDRLLLGGCLLLTTPVGRWEHSGTEAFRSGREHLHHFERGDIEDICRGHEFEVLHAPAAADRSGFQMSSYVWALWPKLNVPLGKVDYDRKLDRLAPRQTVSACIIARNAEGSLRRCVDSFIDWVDEVIVAIDPSTTDRTSTVVEQLQADYPLRPIRWIQGKEAMKEGFAAARNRSVESACGDWILWIDSDEELRNPWNLHRFLRPSEHNGYGWPQVHYAVDPPQVLTKDYPCRLFRNRVGIKFYGYVHEHPELVLGDGIPWSLVRHEMQFLHHGYYDEETRQARFRRNLPLLKRDVEEYPTQRPLNWFLYLRDTAQGIQFDARMRGMVAQEHLEEARRGIKLMERIADLPQTKMCVDSLQYYSLCVATLNEGFEAELTIKTRHPQAPDLSEPQTFNGRFHSRDFFEKLVRKFTQESIKYYDDPHL